MGFSLLFNFLRMSKKKNSHNGFLKHKICFLVEEIVWTVFYLEIMEKVKLDTFVQRNFFL